MLGDAALPSLQLSICFFLNFLAFVPSSLCTSCVTFFDPVGSYLLSCMCVHQALELM